MNLETEWAVLTIPMNAVELTITAKVYLDGELVQVDRTLSMSEIRDAAREAEDYFPPDAVFTITEKGKQWLEEQEANR